MKYFQKKVWFVAGFLFLLLLFVVIFFQVDDMTLAKGEVHNFNQGWTIKWQDGETLTIEELPYLGQSKSGETVVLEGTIPEEYFGKAMAFLSADKELKVWMDGELVYEFGVNDVRLFGHTPGSIHNFIDIPADLKEGYVRMEMVSPYDDYAARVSSITIGERDVLILKLLKDNMPRIVCNLIILICGIIFALLYVIQLSLKQDSFGMQYMCGYCIVTSLYYFVETKALHIFYGNQTLYSVLVFVCLMMIPFFIGLYYANGILGVYQKRWKFLLGLVCANIFLQIVLQLTNLVDFMNMACISHGLIALTVLIVAKSYLDIKKEKWDRNIFLGMLGLLFMGGSGTIDIVRMYVVAIGDMGKFSRLGTTVFSLIMLYQHFGQVIKGYAGHIEESAARLKREMEDVARKNEQLEAAKEFAEEARQEAIAANTAKDKFLAHMSHEIRTPINAVLGMDTMILRETRDLQIKEYALDIQNAGQNLLALINDILDFSKIESGKLEIIPIEYDMSSLIYDIANMIKAKAEAKKLELHIHVDEKLPSKLLGDDVRIRQVVVNLLNNAVKYTPKGTVSLSVGGRIEGRKVLLDFAVEDTGIGIKEEDISKLFKEFERIEEKRNRNIEGTGLGINITTQLLLLMGSRLNVESVYGEGSKFYFTLEQQIVDSTPIGNLEERIRREATEYSYTSTFAAKDAKLLVVDDNPVNLKVFVSLLKCTGVNVDVADSGKACLEMVSRKQYDLIFLDHMMPEMDGIETLHRMKEMPENKCSASPVVALTANAITGAKEMYLTEGFDAFLPKPINPEKLEQMILKLLPRDLLRFDVEAQNGGEQVAQNSWGSRTVESLAAQSAVGQNSGILSGAGLMGQSAGGVASGMNRRNSGFSDEELPAVDGVDWNYGFMHLPDKELLLGTVNDFYKTLNSEADTLDEFYGQIDGNEEMLRQYRIKVHSMKSSANLIGATVIGGMAKLLENAAAEGDCARIHAVHTVFLKEWRSYKDKLRDCVTVSGNGKMEEQEKKAEDASVILEHLEMLQNALAEFDIDKMDEAMAKLEGFQYPETMQPSIDKLGALVTEMNDRQAIVLIEEIKAQIK